MPATPSASDTQDPAPECAAFDRLVNRVLDGDLPASALGAADHPAGCPACRAVRQGAVFLLGRSPRPADRSPPQGFADRVARAAVADFRRRRLLRRASRVGSGALAAGLLIAAWFAYPRSVHPGRAPSADSTATPRPPAVRPVAGLTPPGQPADSIRGQIGEAGSAVAALARKATDETLEPARNLLAARPHPRAPAAKPAADVPEALTELPDAAKAGLEPLANTAKRAVNLFLRDIGGAAGVGKTRS